MSVGVEVQPQSAAGSVGAERRTRSLLAVSGAAMAAQVVATDYGGAPSGVAAFWFVLGCLLLWLVFRKRSRAARGLVIVTSLVGVVAFGLGALGGDAHAAVLASLFLAQAVPLLSRNVRSHVRAVA